MPEHPSVGVEEEFLLVDPGTGEPVPANRAVADAAKARGVTLELELTSCQVETTSSVATTSADLRDELARLRRITADAATTCGTRLLAIGLPPSVPQHFPVTDTPRYREIADRFGMIAHEQGICGCHVHVAVPDRATAVQVSNWLRPWLPALLALTANSAVYHNADTGYASWRSILWARWPSAGPPPFFESLEHYDAAVQMLTDTGAILDDGMVYWDVRPSSSFPTVEVRVADVPATVAESVLLATLTRAAVLTALDDLERGDGAPRVPESDLRAAYWKAARDGLAGHTGLLADLIARIEPALRSLGEHQRVCDELTRLCGEGNGAMRQCQAWLRRGDVGDVIDAAAAATVM